MALVLILDQQLKTLCSTCLLYAIWALGVSCTIYMQYYVIFAQKHQLVLVKYNTVRVISDIVESMPKMCLYSWSALPVSIILASPFSSTCRCPCKSSQTLMLANLNFNWTVKKSNVYPINVFDVDISLFNKDFHCIHLLSCSCHMQCSSLRRKRNYVRQKSTYFPCTL